MCVFCVGMIIEIEENGNEVWGRGNWVCVERRFCVVLLIGILNLEGEGRLSWLFIEAGWGFLVKGKRSVKGFFNLEMYRF